jgi:hypothetical protein
VLYHAKLIPHILVHSRETKFMRPTIALSAVLIATSVIAIPSHAKVSAMLKAGELLDYCTGKDGSLGSAVCDACMMGYMAGVNGTTEPSKPGH